MGAWSLGLVCSADFQPMQADCERAWCMFSVLEALGSPGPADSDSPIHLAPLPLSLPCPLSFSLTSFLFQLSFIFPQISFLPSPGFHQPCRGLELREGVGNGHRMSIPPKAIQARGPLYPWVPGHPPGIP